MFIIQLLLFSSLSCYLAQQSSSLVYNGSEDIIPLVDKSLPDSEDIIPLVDKSFPDSEDINPLVDKSPPDSEDIIPLAADIILRELRECRQRNQDLNQTITNMLKEMADMKEYIESKEEKITHGSLSQQQKTMTEDIIQRLDTLSTRGRWCGYQDDWYPDNSVFSYIRMFFSDSNMNLTETPLDLNTGAMNSQ